MLTRRPGLFLLRLLLICLFAPFVCAAQVPSATVSAALSKGDALAAHQQFEEALNAYREADNLSNHTCADCYLRIANRELDLGKIANALHDFERTAETAGDDGLLAAEAHLVRGQVLSGVAADSSDPNLKQAEQEFRAPISLGSQKTKAHFCLGVLLLGEGRDKEGIAELKAYISGPLANPRYVDRAKLLIAEPSRARRPETEDFSFTSLEGERISKDSLRGSVVLLDFWGSWCPPCRESIPMISDLHRKFAGKSFRLVGISSDDDERSWREFIAAHHMDWPEYIDLDRRVLSIFEINAFPTFIILGRDGTIRFRQSGLGQNSEQDLEKAINAALGMPLTANPSVASGTPTVPAASFGRRR